MVRLGLAAATLTLVFAATTLASPPKQPSERACLIAWNSPANHASRVKLLSERPIAWLMLRAALVGTDTWTKSTVTQTTGLACVMTVMKRSGSRLVTGMWEANGVKSWTFGRVSPASGLSRLEANVRLLADGRVTKIYR